MDIQSPLASQSVSKLRPQTLGGETGVSYTIRIPEGDATVRYALADILPGTGAATQRIISERVQLDTLDGRLKRNRSLIAAARRILRLRMAEANRAARATYKHMRSKSKGPWRYEEFKRIATVKYMQIANRAGVVDELNNLLRERAKLLAAVHNRTYPERRMETYTTAMSLPSSAVECSSNDASPLHGILQHRDNLVVPGMGWYEAAGIGTASFHLRLPYTAVGTAVHGEDGIDYAYAVQEAGRQALKLGVSWSNHTEGESTIPGYNRFLCYPNYNASVPRIVDPGNDQDDEIVRAQTYSRVVSLHGEEDREFVLARSIGELKDLPETFKGGMEFLKFIGSLRNNPIKAVARLKSLQELAGFYLGYKFAIAPTVDDIKTVLSNTREYLTEMRRTCVQLAQQADQPTVRVFRRYKALDYPKYDRETGFFESSIPITNIRATDVAYLDFPQGLLLSEVQVRTPGSHEVPPPAVFHFNNANADLDMQYVTADVQVSSDQPQKWVSSRRTFATVYREWLSHYSGTKYNPLHWPGTTPPGTDYYLWSEAVTQLTHRLGISVTRVPWPTPFSEESDWTCKVGDARVVGAPRPLAYDAPIYVRNLVSGVMYADYATAALHEFLANRGSPFTRFISATDLLLTTWELAPLSFVLDWFTTSHNLWETLQNLSDSYEAPDPIGGVWSTARCELWAALCSLSQHAWSYSSWIPGHADLVSFVRSPNIEAANALSDSYRIAGLSRVNADGLPYTWTYIQPRRLAVQCSVLLHAKRGKYFRTGLYKAKRGELIPSFNWLTSFLRVKLKLNASKLGTLGAMALSWAK